jgi:PAS domain S-box-containing protein
MKFFAIKSIRSKLILLISLFVVVLALAIGWISYSFVIEKIKMERINEVGKVASLRHQSLVAQLQVHRQNVKNLLGRIELFCNLSARIVPVEKPIKESCVFDRLKLFIETERASGVVFRRNKTNTNIIAGRFSKSNLNINQNSFSEGQLAIFQRRGPDNLARAFYVMAIDEKFAAELVVEYPLETIQQIFRPGEDLGSSGETFLADKQGYFITEMRYHAHQGIDKVISARPMQTCLAKNNKEVLDLDYRMEPIIHGFRYIPEIGGGCIMAHIEQSEAFAPLNVFVKQIFLIVTFLLAISLVMVFMFAAAITKPLVYLADIATSIASGAYHLKSEIHRDDEIGRLSKTFNQMTEKLIMANEDIATSSALNSAIIETATDLIITTDQHGIIENCNPSVESILGFSAEDLVGNKIEVLIPVEQISQYQNYLQKVGGVGIELKIKMKSGPNIESFLRLAEIKLRGEVKYIHTFRNLNDLRQMQTALLETEAANKQKSAFLAGMSHEIRTPLNSVIGIIEILLSRSLDKECQDLLKIALAAGENLLSLINDTLDLSRIESGFVEVEKIPFQLAEQIENCMAIMTIKAREKKLNLNYHIDESLKDCRKGDPSRLRQILLNLLSNAVKFSDRGSISIVVKRIFDQQKREKLLFSVTDQGMGIPIEKSELIFEKFKQVDQSVTRKFGGSGLGLAISKKLVELMNGKIWVESRLGEGSTFYFTADLPEVEAMAQGGQAMVNAEKTKLPVKVTAESLPLRQLRILLADDSKDNQLIFEILLKGQNHRITTVENGQEAIDIVKQEKFDLVFMDVQMPVLDGYSATREIRRWERENGLIPQIIVAFTAHAFETDFQESREAGCDEHLTKPLKKAKLFEIVNKYAGNQIRTDRTIEGACRN